MASNYPGSLDSFTNPTSTDAMDASAALYHDVQHAAINDAVEAVQAELGTDPAGAQATVKARLEYAERFMPGGGVWRSGGWVTTALTNTAPATSAADADYIEYVPWWCPLSVTIDRIAVEVTTQYAGGAGRLGIYASNATTGEPSSRLVDAGEFSSTSTGVKELTISQAVTAGTLYWLACTTNITVVAYRVMGAGAARAIGGATDTTTTTARTRFYETRTYSLGLPATATSSMSMGSTVPTLFWLRRT